MTSSQTIWVVSRAVASLCYPSVVHEDVETSVLLLDVGHSAAPIRF